MCNRGVTISYSVTVSGAFSVPLLEGENAETVAREYEGDPYLLLDMGGTIDHVQVEIVDG